MLDRFGRGIEYLRVSITDRCNLRCVYCMPEEGVKSLPHAEILTFEEIGRVVRAASRLGIRAVRLTGGEPMARRGCLDLVETIAHIEGIERVAMTTNGLLLKGRMAEARARGLHSINVSLDTLVPETYRRLTRGGDVRDVLEAIDEALSQGLQVKINAVPVRGFNDRELTRLAELSRARPVDVRFIELMPVGCGASFEPVPTDRVRRMMEEAFGPLTPDDQKRGFGPARYARPDGFMGALGFIGAVSHEFCDRCNRIRLTADGRLKLCLNHQSGVDLKALLRSGADDAALTDAIGDAIERKPLRHNFGEDIDDRERRGMNEIGG